MKRRRVWVPAAAICLAGLLQFFAPQTKGDERMMKIEQNKAIVRDYLNEIVNKGNVSAFDTFFSEDVVFNEARNFRKQYPARMQDPWRLPRPSPDHTRSNCRRRQGRYPRHLSRHARRPIQWHRRNGKAGGMVGNCDGPDFRRQGRRDVACSEYVGTDAADRPEAANGFGKVTG
jgi:hypothetical protein